MKKQNLIASLALFSELYNNKRKISEVLADFIISAMQLKNFVPCNSTDIKLMLKDEYGFDIPESVIRTTLKGLKKDNKVTLKNKEYHFNQKEIINKNNSFEIRNKINEKTDEQEKIFTSLCLFIEKKEQKQLKKQEKDDLFKHFISFLLDSNGSSDRYTPLISAFFISKGEEEQNQKIFQSVKEGVILYQGITYSANITEFGSWNSNLTIYLATEHLFNAVGYNGELYKEIFNDFLSLVNEINQVGKGEKKKINLVYGDETNNEIEEFFLAAENIVRNHIQDESSNTAMRSIIKDCYMLSNVIEKKTKFRAELKEKNISYVHNTTTEPNYNVEDLGVIEELKKVSKKEIDENECLNILKIFTTINAKRRGDNSPLFESIKCIYMTESSLVNYLAHNESVKIEKNDFPFAKNIDFITTQFWYKMNKGFGSKNQYFPKSFNAITKAKIVLSSYITNNVTKIFEEAKKKYEKGEITEEVVVALKRDLENKPQNPEDISKENIDDTFDFLQNDDYVESVNREISLKDQKIKEKEDIIEEKNTIIKEKDNIIESLSQEKREREAKEYSEKQWKNQIKKDRMKIIYTILFSIFNIFIIVISLSGGIFTFAEELGFSQLISWILLIISVIISIILLLYKQKYLKIGYRLINEYIRKYSSYKTKCKKRFEEQYFNLL